jgi:YidC/Oxa1 family membrane protein insertase
MMDKRTVLAVALSLMVLMGWSIFFHKPPAPPQKKTVQETGAAPTVQSAARGTPTARQEAGKDAITPQKGMPSTLFAGNGGEDILVETDLYRAVLSTRGAVLKHWELKDYKDNNGNPVTLLKEPGNIPPLSILLEGPDRSAETYL